MKTLIISMMLLLTTSIYNAQTQTFQFEGIRRYFEVHTPQNIQEDMPLVIVLHGWSGSIAVQKTWSATHKHADTAGYVVVYAEGTEKSWNFGLDYCPIRKYLPTANDVGFISALIDTVSSQHSIDIKRIYCVGWSTGGEMAYRLACQLGHRFAAVASVGGGMCDAAYDWYPVKAMPVMEIHGTQDYYYQYYGPGSYNRYFSQSKKEWSISKVLKYWAERNQCYPVADTINMPDIVLDDNCTAQRISYSGGIDGSEVVHYKIITGGHSWPGSPTPHPYWDLEGNRNRDINATVEIWNFFKKHQNPVSDLAFARNIKTDPSCIGLSDSSISFTTELHNPESHSVEVFAFVQNKDQTFSDTLQLFDDGMHNDGEANDNLWGISTLYQGLSEDMFTVNLLTNDLDYDTLVAIHYPSEIRFTTIGPVTLSNYTIESENTIPKPGDYIKIKVNLKNEGASVDAANVKAELSCVDKDVRVIYFGQSNFTIVAGETNSPSGYFRIGIPEDYSGSRISLDLKISSEGFVFWRDTLSIPVETPLSINETNRGLISIYPNPTNDRLTIETANPASHTITIHSLNGQLIYSTEMEGDIYQLDLSSFREGIYFIMIRSRDQVWTEKIIKL